MRGLEIKYGGTSFQLELIYNISIKTSLTKKNKNELKRKKNKQERLERMKKKQLPAFCVKKQEPFFTSTRVQTHEPRLTAIGPTRLRYRCVLQLSIALSESAIFWSIV